MATNNNLEIFRSTESTTEQSENNSISAASREASTQTGASILKTIEANNAANSNASKYLPSVEIVDGTSPRSASPSDDAQGISGFLGKLKEVAGDIGSGIKDEVVNHTGTLIKDTAIGAAFAVGAAFVAPEIVIGAAVVGVGAGIFEVGKNVGKWAHAASVAADSSQYSAQEQEAAHKELHNIGQGLAELGAGMAGGGVGSLGVKLLQGAAATEIGVATTAAGQATTAERAAVPVMEATSREPIVVLAEPEEGSSGGLKEAIQSGTAHDGTLASAADGDPSKGTAVERAKSSASTQRPLDAIALQETTDAPMQNMVQTQESPALARLLSTPAEVGEFGEALEDAVREIAQAAGTRPVNAAPYSLIDKPNLQESLLETVRAANDTGKFSFWRGSKMDPTMGSFQSLDGGVHLTPNINTAIGYADSVNSQTGIGRLLGRMGFVSRWDVPLERQVSGNFELEGRVEGNGSTTIQNMVDSLEQVAKLPAAAFERIKSAGGGHYASPAETELGKMFENSYEAASGKGEVPREIMIRLPEGKLVKVDPANPQWDQVLARVQEANLRDTYEIQPLEDAIQSLGARISSQAQPELVQTVLDAAEKQLGAAKNAPWQMKSMGDLGQYLEDRPYISGSERVGSAIGADPKYPPEIERIRQALNAIQTGNHAAVPNILSPAPNAI